MMMNLAILKKVTARTILFLRTIVAANHWGATLKTILKGTCNQFCYLFYNLDQAALLRHRFLDVVIFICIKGRGLIEKKLHYKIH